MWIERYSQMLKLFLSVERLAVAAASVFAFFPLWQYLDETDDRQLDRDATLILAHASCETAGVLTLIERLEDAAESVERDRTRNLEIDRQYPEFAAQIEAFLQSARRKELPENITPSLIGSGNVRRMLEVEQLMVRCAKVVQQNVTQG